MDNIICPNCGMPNPDDQNTCSFCRQPLRMTGNGDSIKPGDMPTKKSTAELEPVLPQWLREAREKARQAAEETAAAESQAAAAQPAPQDGAVQDWLAGLEASAREEEQEETPEWMRGAPAAPPAATQDKPEKLEKTDEPFPRRQEIRWEDEPAEEEVGGLATPFEPIKESDDGIPFWMKGMQEEPADEKVDEVASWLSKQEQPPAATQAEPPSPFESGTFRPNTGELASWLDKLSAAPASSTPDAEPAAPSESLPDWLANLPRDEIQPEPAADDSNRPMTGSFNWLQNEPAQPSAPAQESSAPSEPLGADLDLPEWMKRTSEASAPSSNNEQLSAWLKSQAEPAATPKHEEAELPDWMKTEPPASSAASTDDLPSWLSSQSSQGEATANAPAFIPGQEPISKDEVDNLFSIEMPDWLSKIEPGEQKAGPAAPAAQEDLSPADLPSWVQAMRPVETVLPGVEDAASAVAANQPLEEQGPLAGLRGVLPILPGLVQSGKPKPLSVRLQPTQDQQENAALLEQLLAAETEAKPIRSGSSTILSQRALRWALTVILLVVIIIGLFNANPLVPLPSILPDESEPIPGLLDALPIRAPVLLIVDYEAALAGEMEAAAAPVLNLAMALRSPRFTVLSTSPTGAALAERLLTGATLSRHSYQHGANYTNLGYLPGGTMGIQAFVQNPRFAMPLNTDGLPAWESAAAQDIHSYTDYALIILLTDRAESARAWVEQTEGQRDGRPMLVVSSAQSAPMILPYFISGQVNGLVSGVLGGAAFADEADFSTAARLYWNSFHLAALVVLILIVFGGLWNWIAGMRARARGMDEV